MLSSTAGRRGLMSFSNDARVFRVSIIRDLNDHGTQLLGWLSFLTPGPLGGAWCCHSDETVHESPRSQARVRHEFFRERRPQRH